MSLLMKALKRAEESRSPGPQARVPGSLAEGLALEAFGPEESRAPGSMWNPEHAASLAAAQGAGPGARRSLLPWIAGVAALVLAAWGVYVYLMVRQPPALTVAMPAPAMHLPAPAAGIAAAAPAPAPPEPAPMPAEPVHAAPVHGRVAAHEVPPAPAAAPAKPPRDSAPRRQSSVSVTTSAAPAAPSPVLLDAYRAFQEGRYGDAEKLYQTLLQSEPRNQDALLGMAATAQQQGKPAQAGSYYLRAIELDPKNALAQAGLASLAGAADPAATQARLQQLLATQGADPGKAEQTAALHFALGNLYAEQSRWAEAEQAYFQAQRLAPDNPDYAFNLAVSLDHLFQAKPALTYYQRAQQLLHSHASANLDAAALAKRIAQLAAAPDAGGQ